MAAAKTPTPVLKVPGVEDPTNLGNMYSQGIAIFVKGLDAFTTIMNGDVTLEGTGGKTVAATVTGTRVGRLYTLTQEFMGQVPTTYLGAQQSGSYSFQDVNHFTALADTYGKDAIGPLEPYTVIHVRVSPAMPTMPVPTNPQS